MSFNHHDISLVGLVLISCLFNRRRRNVFVGMRIRRKGPEIARMIRIGIVRSVMLLLRKIVHKERSVRSDGGKDIFAIPHCIYWAIAALLVHRPVCCTRLAIRPRCGVGWMEWILAQD